MENDPTDTERVYKLRRKDLKVVSLVDLGILISEDLFWNKHVRTICAKPKTNRMLGVLKRNCVSDLLKARCTETDTQLVFKAFKNIFYNKTNEYNCGGKLNHGEQWPSGWVALWQKANRYFYLLQIITPVLIVRVSQGSEF